MYFCCVILGGMHQKHFFGAFLANSFSFTLVLLWAQCFKNESLTYYWVILAAMHVN